MDVGSAVKRTFALDFPHLPEARSCQLVGQRLGLCETGGIAKPSVDCMGLCYIGVSVGFVTIQSRSRESCHVWPAMLQDCVQQGMAVGKKSRALKRPLRE